MDLNPAEAKVVREIASRLLAGESLRSVTGWLNSTELRPTGKGTSWSGPTVKQMVLRASIAGLRTHKGEIVGPTAHPAILDKDVWQSVVALLSNPARRRSHSSARTHLLSGLARCGKCQAGLRSTQVKGHRRYWCAECMGLAIAQEPLDLFITTAVLERIRTVKKPKRAGDPQFGTKILALRARLDEIAERAVDPSAPLALLEKMAAKVTAELHVAEAAQEALLSQQVLDAFDTSVADRWEELPLSRRRAILDAVIECLVILPSRGTGRFDVNRIEITWR
jgi:site-specific DNA recombinase